MGIVKAQSEDGPWERLDAEKLKREAELKEKKLKRKKAAAEARTLVRQERRNEKAAAKLARRANVKRAANWNEERRALGKQKKLTNRPAKDEKRRVRMIPRAEKLEEQAKKLWAEAQKTRARYAYLTGLKEKQEAEEEEQRLEMEVARRTETDTYVTVNVDGEEDEDSNASEVGIEAGDVTSMLSKQLPKALLAAKPMAAAVTSEVELTEVSVKLQLPPTNGTGHSASEKQDLEDHEPEDEIMPAPSAPADKKKKKKKDKKKERAEEPELVAEDGEATEVTPKKKKKKVQQPEDVAGTVTAEVEEPQPKADKTGKKRKREENGIVTGATLDDAVPKKSKKEKKEKKDKKDKKVSKGHDDQRGYDVNAPSLQDDKADATAGQWDVSGLSGGAKRQEKYLRLLGGKKHGVTLTDTAADGTGQKDRATVETELERQFEEGTRMKLDGRGQHRGLGA